MTYFGGKRENMPLRKRKTLTGRGAVGKTAVIGMKDRESGKTMLLPSSSSVML